MYVVILEALVIRCLEIFHLFTLLDIFLQVLR